MTQEARSAASSRKHNTTSAKADARAAAVFQHYQAAVQLLQQSKFEKALAALEKLLPDAPDEIKERCRMYISTCRKQLEKASLAFNTPEEQYDYAVSQLNTGYYETAREQFNSIVSKNPGADYAYYGLAVLDAITGRSQDCLSNLARSIELNGKNRLQARVDNDFQSMVDDPRFTELLYPEIPLGLFFYFSFIAGHRLSNSFEFRIFEPRRKFADRSRGPKPDRRCCTGLARSSNRRRYRPIDPFAGLSPACHGRWPAP
jgi:tetratricopeptide (TPR) repeat protein